ncbi:hypothetical protein DRQ07_00420 [candidate division KSB1 bacterium]|nr:MAG: hypothetical protein DRQ07_00420 [candidate division KSB1 bacterium]
MNRFLLLRLSKINIFCPVILVVFLLFSCSTKDGSDIVAQVDGSVLTRAQLKKQIERLGLRQDQEHEFVEKWINDQLLYLEAKRQGFDKSKDLREELERVKKEFMIQKLLEKTYAEKIKVTEEEIASYYHNNMDLFKVNEDEVRIQHILTKTRAEAGLAMKEIKAGKAFKDVAKERSIGPFAGHGGDIGFFTKKDVIPEVARYAFRIPEGSLSPIFKSVHGYHILKVLKKRKKGSIKDLDDIRDEIAQRIRVTKERSVYYDLLFQLQHSEKISINVPGKAGDTSGKITETNN